MPGATWKTGDPVLCLGMNHLLSYSGDVMRSESHSMGALRNSGPESRATGWIDETELYSAKADTPPTAQAGESGCVPALIVALHSDAEAAPATLALAIFR